MAENTGCEPNIPDDFHYSETTEIFFRDESSDAVPSYSCDAELDDETIGRALSSPLFIQEREEPADRRQAYQYYKESLVPAQSLSVCHTRTGRPVHELSSLSSCSRKKPSRDSENERIRILLERQKEQILADFRAEIQKHEFQADSDRRSIQELSGIIESQRREIDHALAGDKQLRRNRQLLHEQLSEQNRDLREAHMKSLNEMEEVKRFQGSTFDEFSRKRLIEDRDTTLNSQPRSVRSGLSHVPSQPALFPPFRDPGGKAVLWEYRAATMGRQTFGTRMVHRETFL